MKQKFDALTDLVEHVQEADVAEPQTPAPNAPQVVVNEQGEKIILDDKTR